MKYEWLEKKIQESYKVLRLAAEMSLEYYHKPLLIMYSGGKDSDVLLQLAIECLDKNAFEVMNSHTTVDAPETVYYIRDRFKELEAQGIKTTIHIPHDKDGNPITMWNLIVKKLMPPTRLSRYCCQYLKEVNTPNRFVALGVRKDESTGRRGRDVFATYGRTKKDAYYYYYYSHVEEVYNTDKRWRERERVTANTESVLDCTLITKAKRNENLICNAIYEWTDNDIWTFIEERGMKYNPLYDKGFKRVGCIGCPLAGKDQAREFALYPKYKENYIKAFDRMLEARRKLGKNDVTGKTGLNRWTDGNVVFRWWTRDDSIDGQIELTDYLQEMEEKDDNTNKDRT